MKSLVWFIWSLEKLYFKETTRFSAGTSIVLYTIIKNSRISFKYRWAWRVKLTFHLSESGDRKNFYTFTYAIPRGEMGVMVNSWAKMGRFFLPVHFPISHKNVCWLRYKNMYVNLLSNFKTDPRPHRSANGSCLPALRISPYVFITYIRDLFSVSIEKP